MTTKTATSNDKKRARCGQGSYWSPFEIEKLGRLVEAGFNYSYISKQIGRSERSVAMKANKMGMMLSEVVGKRWQKDEDQEVFDVLMEVKLVSKSTGRSVKSCINRLRTLANREGL